MLSSPRVPTGVSVHPNFPTMTTMLQRAATLAMVLSAATATAPRARAQSAGEAVLQRMHDAYAGKWYHTLRFVQKTTQHRPDGTAVIGTWYESLRHTGAGVELRIDIGAPANGNGILYTADSSWRFRGGKLLAASADGNEFLPLIEGVYVQPVARTMADLAGAHIDFSRVSHAMWEGKPATVIGAASPSDSTLPQLWVDDERNVLVRMIILAGPNGPPLDVHLGDYVPVGQGWLATKVVLLAGGQPRQVEEYADWRVDGELPAELFSRTAWIPAQHWANR